MKNLITFLVENFAITLLVLGLLCSFVDLSLKQKPLHKHQIIESFFAYFLLFGIGLTFLCNFVFHVFFAELSASAIGWENSPFQYEVGYASLGFAIAGIIAFKQNLSFRAATIIGPLFFLWGAAGGHVYQMITADNFAPGNAGSIFWWDIFMPIIAFVLLYQQYKQERTVPSTQQ